VKTPTRLFSMAALVTGFLPAIGVDAFAGGNVIKQNKCRVLMDGLSSATVGATATLILTDGTKVFAKIKTAKPPRALADIDAGNCNVNAVGAEVVIAGAEKGGRASAAAPKGKNGIGLAVAVEGGWGSTSIEREVGDQKSLAHAGPEVIGTVRYAHTINPNFLLGVLAGGGWLQKGVQVNSEQPDGTSVQFDLNTVSVFGRVGGGGIYAIKPNLRLSGYGLFDYGFSGKYEVIYAQESSGYTGASHPLTFFARYGAQVEFDYNVVAGLWIGAGGNLLMGTMTFGDNVNSDTTSDEEKGPFGTLTYGGVLKLSYEF
jgi:hypothetical protein